MNLTLFALFLASFGIGTTEYVPIGILPNIASDLHITISEAGLLISSYAIGVTLGSPLVAILTTRLSRHTAMMWLILIFIVGNGLSTIAPNYGFLIGSRLLASLCHGAFFGIGAVVAAQVVPAKQKAHAIAIMFAGLTVANIIGVPLDTLIGQRLGWRAAFGLISLIGLLGGVALYLWIPRQLPLQRSPIFLECRALFRSQVAMTMLMSVLSSASLFCVLTYIAPLLENVTKVSAHSVTFFLILFGIGITVGNLIGGKLADWKLMPSMIGTFVLLVLTLILFTLTVHYVYLAAFTIFLWGLLSFAVIAPLQMRVVQEASGAPNLASTINQSAFHLGNSSGALIGSMMIGYGMAYPTLMWAGMWIAVFALAVNIYAYIKETKCEDLAWRHSQDFQKTL